MSKVLPRRLVMRALPSLAGLLSLDGRRAAHGGSADRSGGTRAATQRQPDHRRHPGPLPISPRQALASLQVWIPPRAHDFRLYYLGHIAAGGYGPLLRALAGGADAAPGCGGVPAVAAAAARAGHRGLAHDCG